MNIPATGEHVTTTTKADSSLKRQANRQRYKETGEIKKRQSVKDKDSVDDKASVRVCPHLEIVFMSRNDMKVAIAAEHKIAIDTGIPSHT